MKQNKHKSAQLPLALNVSDKANFSNFHHGDNSELIAAIQSYVKRSESRSLYFYGPSSTGKSHLLFAAMRLAKNEGIKCSYLSLADSRISPEFLQELDLQHIICVDNVNEWAGDDFKEAALFTMFEQIKHSGGHLIISAGKLPELCGFKLVDLVSRLASGLVYPLLELTDKQQAEAVKMRANERGLIMADEVINYLLSRSSRNTGELFAILDKIDRASLIEKRKVTIPFLRSIVSS